ncbi:MAG TPA: hypothetical protein VLC48_07625 [Gemmatimonadota bacterium]|nr:hypothetical protein [Gemmatimonadota bacterium]
MVHDVMGTPGPAVQTAVRRAESQTRVTPVNLVQRLLQFYLGWCASLLFKTLRRSQADHPLELMEQAGTTAVLADRGFQQRRDAGFGMVEATLALVILTAGLLGLAASGTFAQRQVTKAHLRSQSMEQARIQLEELLAQPYGDLVSGACEVDGVQMAWTVTDMRSNKEIVLVYQYYTGGGVRVDTVVAGARSP